MLILTRRIGERVMIGKDITVVLVSISGNQVKLGFNAPKEVAVHREEVASRINAEAAIIASERRLNEMANCQESNKQAEVGG